MTPMFDPMEFLSSTMTVTECIMVVLLLAFVAFLGYDLVSMIKKLKGRM